MIGQRYDQSISLSRKATNCTYMTQRNETNDEEFTDVGGLKDVEGDKVSGQLSLLFDRTLSLKMIKSHSRFLPSLICNYFLFPKY